MGIPKLSSILAGKWSLNEQVGGGSCWKDGCDALYIDLNSVLYTCCGVSASLDEFHEKIKQFITKLVETFGPRRLVYLSLDGVPPLSKLKEQNSRRRARPKKQFIDLNEFTPGTQFMNSLSKELEKFAGEDMKVKCVLSDSNEPGEGEQKIVRHLRQLEESESAIIFCNDADFIILSLFTTQSIKLARDTSFRSSIDRKLFELFDIDKLKQSLASETGNPNIASDFGLLLILLGNDYLPNPSTLPVERAGVDLLLKSLKQLYTDCGGSGIVSNNTINWNNFNVLFQLLADYELAHYKLQYPLKKPAIQRAILELELNGLSLKERKSKIKAHIDELHNGQFLKHRAYFYESMNSLVINDLPEVIESYYRTVQWVYSYYSTDFDNWNWIYNYEFTPFFTDLALQPQHEAINFKHETPLKPLHQLAFVLPSKSHNLLPGAYQSHKFSDVFAKSPLNFTEIADALAEMRALDGAAST